MWIPIKPLEACVCVSDLQRCVGVFRTCVSTQAHAGLTYNPERLVSPIHSLPLSCSSFHPLLFSSLGMIPRSGGGVEQQLFVCKEELSGAGQGIDIWEREGSKE